MFQYEMKEFYNYGSKSLRSYDNDGNSASYISDNGDRGLLLRHHHWKTQRKRHERAEKQQRIILQSQSWIKERSWNENLQTSCKKVRPQQAFSYHNTNPTTARPWKHSKTAAKSKDTRDGLVCCICKWLFMLRWTWRLENWAFSVTTDLQH